MANFKTMADVRNANKESGHHFFDRDTMRFWASKIESDLYGGAYFITSEKGAFDTDPRRYTVRLARADGTIVDASDFRQFGTIEEARVEARTLALAVAS